MRHPPSCPRSARPGQCADVAVPSTHKSPRSRKHPWKHSGSVKFRKSNVRLRRGEASYAPLLSSRRNRTFSHRYPRYYNNAATNYPCLASSRIGRVHVFRPQYHCPFRLTKISFSQTSRGACLRRSATSRSGRFRHTSPAVSQPALSSRRLFLAGLYCRFRLVGLCQLREFRSHDVHCLLDKVADIELVMPHIEPVRRPGPDRG